MKAKVWGCRGSLAAPGPETVRYGGNTSCVQILPSDERMVVIDAGTGIRGLGVALGNRIPERIDLLLTHLHLDHIEGLGFFRPMWDPNAEVHIWGPPLHGRPLRERVATYFSPPLFPVHLDEVPAVHFHDVQPDQEWQLGATRVRAQLVNHPGPTLGYRLEDEGSVFTYISDHEPAKGVVDLMTTPPEWVSGYSLAERAEVLLHDAQYTEDEYSHRVGWGHSAVSHTVAFALLAKVQRLFLFHHDPLHSDAQLEAILGRARELWGSGDDAVALAYEGMEIEIG